MIEIADEGMVFEKAQRELGRRLGEQGLEIPQAPRALLKGAGGSPLDEANGVVIHQSQKALENPDPLDPADLVHPLGPVPTGLAHEGGAFEHPFDAAFDEGALVAVDVGLVGAEASRIHSGVKGYWLHPLVKEAYEPRLPADPDLLADELRRNGVEGFLEFNVTVPVDGSPGLGEHREETGRQRLQAGLFHFPELLSDLTASGAMKSGVGHGPFPLDEVSVLSGQARKLAAFESVVLAVLDA